MKRSRPIALLSLVIYLWTATGLAEASLLGYFNTATYPPAVAKNQPAVHDLSPVHEVEPSLDLELACLIKNCHVKESVEDNPDFFVISTELVIWPIPALPLQDPPPHEQPASPLRSDPLSQFGTLSLQV